MKSKKSLFTAALLAGVCVFALTACESMDSAWNNVTGDAAPYAGDVQQQPQQQAQQMQPQMQQPQMNMSPQQQAMYQPQPVQPIYPQALPPVYPQQQASMQPLQPTQTVIPPTAMQPIGYQQVPVQNNYQPNLASVPARPTANQLPNAQQVQTARAELTNDNRRAMGTLRDPHETAAMQTSTTTTYTQTTQPLPPQTASAPNYTAGTGQLLGLQATAPGKYALTPLAPEAPLGGFALASSLQYAPGNDQVTMPQYQELRRVAGQYAVQPGRVRVVSYGDAQNPQALQRATTAAAYLVDLGVPANAIRVKMDNSAGPQQMSKTDIFLETQTAR